MVKQPVGLQDTLFILTGPTASGKTAYALEWAEKTGAEIISCDSLLFYRGMDIGTAKPTPSERSKIPHYGIDIVPVNSPVDVGQYAQWAQAWVDQIAARGRPILVVGGSGFYLKSFFSPVVDGLGVPSEVAMHVNTLYQEEGLSGVLGALQRWNPQGLGSLDTHNPRRVLAALKRCEAAQASLAELQARFTQLPEPFAQWRKYLVVLEAPSDVILQQRIAQRTAQMLQSGLVEEVQALTGEGLLENPSAQAAIGYREVLAYFQGAVPTRMALESLINRNTWRLVKKQRTWLRGQLKFADRYPQLP